jgi:hypothetical protein
MEMYYLREALNLIRKKFNSNVNFNVSVGMQGAQREFTDVVVSSEDRSFEIKFYLGSDKNGIMTVKPSPDSKVVWFLMDNIRYERLFSIRTNQCFTSQILRVEDRIKASIPAFNTNRKYSFLFEWDTDWAHPFLKVHDLLLPAQSSIKLCTKQRKAFYSKAKEIYALLKTYAHFTFNKQDFDIYGKSLVLYPVPAINFGSGRPRLGFMMYCMYSGIADKNKIRNNLTYIQDNHSFSEFLDDSEESLQSIVEFERRSGYTVGSVITYGINTDLIMLIDGNFKSCNAYGSVSYPVVPAKFLFSDMEFEQVTINNLIKMENPLLLKNGMATFGFKNIDITGDYNVDSKMMSSMSDSYPIFAGDVVEELYKRWKPIARSFAD